MVEECNETRIHGLRAVSNGRVCVRIAQVPLGVEGDALGPRGLGLELRRSAGRNGVRWWGRGRGGHALVNMEGVDMVVRAKPQLQAAGTASIGRSDGNRLAGGLY